MLSVGANIIAHTFPDTLVRVCIPSMHVFYVRHIYLMCHLLNGCHITTTKRHQSVRGCSMFWLALPQLI